MTLENLLQLIEKDSRVSLDKNSAILHINDAIFHISSKISTQVEEVVDSIEGDVLTHEGELIRLNSISVSSDGEKFEKIRRLTSESEVVKNEY